MAKGVAQFVLCESFAYIAGDGTVDDFRERLLVDVSKRNLSAMVEAAGDNATVMKNCDMGVKRTTSTNRIMRPFGRPRDLASSLVSRQGW